MNVLLITRSQDNYCTPLVQEALAKRGGKAWRLDTDRFPTDHKLSLEIGADSDRMLFENEQGRIDLREMDALYYRRFYPGDGLPKTLPAQHLAAAAKETQLTLLGLLYGLHCFELDTYEKVRRAETKQLQLQVAKTVGLEIPHSLSTNDPAAVRAFFEAHPDGIIGKMMGSFAIYEEGIEKVVFTNRIKAEDLDALDSLRYSPMTFQAAVPKALELRVTVVGDRVFAASIDSQASKAATHDWRRDGNGMLDQWQHHQLPADVAARVLRLMDAFGLNYGAMDFILTPDGRYVFLEVNPVGEFMWLEKWPGLPIAESIADVLMGLAPRRLQPEWELLHPAPAPAGA